MIAPSRSRTRPCPARSVRTRRPDLRFREMKWSTSTRGTSWSRPLNAARAPDAIASGLIESFGATEVVALADLEADLTARVSLADSLDPFGQGSHALVAGKSDEGREQAPASGRRLVDRLDEAPIELEEIGRRLGKLQESRLTGAEVVVRQADLHLRENRTQRVEGCRTGQNTLVDLQRQIEVRCGLA